MCRFDMVASMPDGTISYARFLELLEVQAKEDLVKDVQSITELLGFDHFMYGGWRMTGTTKGLPELILLGSYPDAWMMRYAERRYDRIDPCIAYCQQYSNPIPWTRKFFYSAPGAHEFYEEAMSYGVSAGAFSPVVMGAAGFGIARGEDADLAYMDSVNVLPWLHLLGSFVHTALLRFETGDVQEPPRITPREVQCLERAAQGLRDAEIADALRISERTVLMHMGNARRKLAAQNRAQLIAKAILAGVIRP